MDFTLSSDGYSVRDVEQNWAAEYAKRLRDELEQKHDEDIGNVHASLEALDDKIDNNFEKCGVKLDDAVDLIEQELDERVTYDELAAEKNDIQAYVDRSVADEAKARRASIDDVKDYVKTLAGDIEELPLIALATDQECIEGTVSTKAASPSGVAAKLDDYIVDGDHIAKNAITSNHIREGNITTGKIHDLNVTTAKLADAAVTLPKLSVDCLPHLSVDADGKLTLSPFAAMTGANVPIEKLYSYKLRDSDAVHPIFSTEAPGLTYNDMVLPLGTIYVYLDPASIGTPVVLGIYIATSDNVLASQGNSWTKIYPLDDPAVNYAVETTEPPSSYNISAKYKVGCIYFFVNGGAVDKIYLLAAVTEGVLGGTYTWVKIYDSSFLSDSLELDSSTVGASARAVKLLNDKIAVISVADGSITEEKIFDGAVSSRKLSDRSVSFEKLDLGLTDYLTSPQRVGTWVDERPIWRVAVEVVLTSSDFENGYYELSNSVLGVSDRSLISRIINGSFRTYYPNNDAEDSLPASVGDMFRVKIDTSNTSYVVLSGWIEFATPASNIA